MNKLFKNKNKKRNINKNSKIPVKIGLSILPKILNILFWIEFGKILLKIM